MSVSSAIQIFEEAGVLADQNVTHVDPPSLVSELRSIGYEDQWERRRASFFFHALLEGEHLVVLEENCFRFIMSPYSILPFERFVDQFFGWDESLVEDFSADLRAEYDMYVSAERVRSRVLPVRVDYHEAGYKPGLHSACHMHVGIQDERNGLRVPIRRRMSMDDFAYFLVRHFYPYKWESYLETLAARNRIGEIKRSINLAPLLWESNLDGGQYFLG